MAETTKKTSLRTIADLQEAHEWLFNKQKDGTIDAKAVDGLNTTLKGAVYLNVKLKLDAAKLITTASIKKIELPKWFGGILPE